MSARSAASRESAEQHVARAHRRSTARLAAERAEQRLGREVVDQLVGVELGRAARAGTRRRPSASASTPPTPSITHGPNCGSRHEPGDELAGARAPSARRAARPRRRRARAAASSSGRRGARPRRRRQPEAHETPFGLVRDRVAAQLDDHDRVADRVGGGDRAVGVGAPTRSSSTGTPYRARSCFDSASDRVARRTVLGAHTDGGRGPRQYSSRSTRFSSLPESVRGSSSRTS